MFETLDDPVSTIEDLFVSFIIAIIILHKLSFVLLVRELLSSDKIIVRIERAYTDGYKKILTSHQPNSSNCIDIIIVQSSTLSLLLVLNLSHNTV